MRHKKYTRACWTSALLALFMGCAFDVVQVKQMPASFSPATSSTNAFVLAKGVKVKIGTGFPTVLNPSTTWTQAGGTQFGDVYLTKDQIVKVEASNIHEAWIVISNQCLVGFYLPVEKTFSPLSSPMTLEITTVNK